MTEISQQLIECAAINVVRVHYHVVAAPYQSTPIRRRNTPVSSDHEQGYDVDLPRTEQALKRHRMLLVIEEPQPIDELVEAAIKAR